MSHSQFFEAVKLSKSSIQGKSKEEALTQRKLSDSNFNSNVIKTSRRKEFSEKLWFCGKSVGEFSGKMTFYNLPMLYQMKVGVLSKAGISFTSKPILLENRVQFCVGRLETNRLSITRQTDIEHVQNLQRRYGNTPQFGGNQLSE